MIYDPKNPPKNLENKENAASKFISKGELGLAENYSINAIQINSKIEKRVGNRVKNGPKSKFSPKLLANPGDVSRSFMVRNDKKTQKSN